jgi:sucrose phosphorylase
MNENAQDTSRQNLFKDAVFLYGENAAREFISELNSLIKNFREKNPAPVAARASLPLSERDALLITYGDQISEPGKSPLKTLDEVAQKYLSGVVSGVHILPFFPWSSDDGFSVKDYFAVDSALGDWNDIRELGKHFDLMFDAVFNHMSAQSDWFKKFLEGDPAFEDFFVTVEGNPDLSQVVRPRALPLLTEFQTATGRKKVWTTFSADQVDLDVRNPKVLLALLKALLFYIENGAKFIRLDAIAFLWKQIGTRCLHLPETHRVIQLMRAALDEAAPNVMLITETNVPHADNISYFGNGANEAQLVYNFALPPLVLHSLATGNAEKLTRWAQSLELPSNEVTFFNFLASHDGIGVNPARGILSDTEIDALVSRTLEHGGLISYKNNPDGSRSPYEMNISYFDALSNPAANEAIEMQVDRFICAQAIMFALAGVPGIYFHSLFGSRGDRSGADASGIPRRINRKKLTRTELENDLRTPDSLRSHVFNRLETLLKQRASEPAFNPTAPQRVLEIDPRIFAVERTAATGKKILCLHNVSAENIQVPTDGALKTAVELKPYEFIWLPSCN